MNNYIVGIKSISGEKKAIPYRAIMAQLQENVEALSKIHIADKSSMI